jgi:glycerol-3-phosphate dehydrogenase
MKRHDILEKIRRQPDVPVLIIGGGINGLGSFRDIALQGVDVLLIERGDFASGASAASSHMVHGGIRYLENGEFRLVREAVQERNRLIENAPHYVKPLPTTIPIFKRFSGLLNAPLKFLGLLDRPSERGAIVIKLGLMMYDAYARQQGTVPPHTFTGRQASLERYPALNPDIIATATYYDAAMPSPERLAIEVMLDGEAAHAGAHALNYVSAVGANGAEVLLRDEETGETLAVRPQLVINAAGPWIDLANRAMGVPTAFIGGTKGSHIVLEHPELLAALDGHEFFFENSDGRIVLIFPLLDRVIVGTSDIPIEEPDDARCTEEEIDYFLAFTRQMFPSISVDRSHIVFQFSGVRPLPASDANSAGQISRDHENRIVEPGNGIGFPIFNLIGGKWTTFRAFSEHVADDALARLGRKRQTSTKELAIGGGRDYPTTDSTRQAWLEQLSVDTGLVVSRLEQLLDRYGTRAEGIAHAIAQAPDPPLASAPTFSANEVAFIVEQEKVLHLGDFFERRSLLAMSGRLTNSVVEEFTQVIAETLAWPPERTRDELARLRAHLAEHHGLNLADEPRTDGKSK